MRKFQENAVKIIMTVASLESDRERETRGDFRFLLAHLLAHIIMIQKNN